MKDLQKERIIQLRISGVSYSKIADALGISINTVKSFCRRNNLGNNEVLTKDDSNVNQIFCKECGKELNQVSGKKPLKFCSNQCRVKWWNSHPEMVNKKAIYSYRCPYCGKTFTAYGNSKRKYCSHSCYIAHRFGGECLE
jgi:endogenous inhibitor of DNA gyrase (YacG/DUF329 family)